jgi:hypothetical protein
MSRANQPTIKVNNNEEDSKEMNLKNRNIQNVNIFAKNSKSLESHKPTQKHSNGPVSFISDFKTWKMSGKVHPSKIINRNYFDNSIRASKVDKGDSNENI